MRNQDRIRYLANVYHVLASDEDVTRVEEESFDEIARGIGAGYFEKKQAIEMAKNQGLQIPVSERWSQRIGNLEDMFFAAYCNGILEPGERKAIVEYAKHLGIDQKQLSLIQKEAKRRHEESGGKPTY